MEFISITNHFLAQVAASMQPKQSKNAAQPLAVSNNPTSLMPGKSPVSYTIYPNNTTNLAHPAGSKTAKPSKTVAPVIDGNRNTVDKGKLPLFVEKKGI